MKFVNGSNTSESDAGLIFSQRGRVPTLGRSYGLQDALSRSGMSYLERLRESIKRAFTAPIRPELQKGPIPIPQPVPAPPAVEEPPVVEASGKQEQEKIERNILATLVSRV